MTIDPDAGTIEVDRTLRAGGNSTVVSIPPELLAQAGIKKGDSVVLATEPGGSGRIEIRSKDEE